MPLRLIFEGRREDVTLARRPWRVSQHWWRGDPIDRLYFRVVPEDGPPLTIYRDLKTVTWSRQEY